MQRRIHMHDQVNNKVDAIMRHRYGSGALELWGIKALLLAAFLLVGVYYW
jgi:hypothetical protein